MYVLSLFLYVTITVDSGADSLKGSGGCYMLCWKRWVGRLLTHPAFMSPPWRNTLILITASVLIYPYLPSPQKYSASPSVSPDQFSSTSTSSDAPWVTRQLAKYTPESKVWTDRNDKHLELSKEKAEERLLFQEAERPKVHRMRYPR